MVDMVRFNDMLRKCEQVKGNVALTNWEREFVLSIRENFDAREAQEDLGLTAWVPTRSQYNTLHGIWSKL